MRSRPTRAQVEARIAALGATLRTCDCELCREVVVAAPAGYVWTESQLHELVVCDSDGGPLGPLFREAFVRMAPGVEPCDDAACDICHPEGGDPIADPQHRH